MDIPGHGKVSGDWDLGDFDQYIGGVDVTGKSVLDVGCASGYLSFEAERRGAEVTSFDAASVALMSRIPFAENLYFRNRDLWNVKHEWDLQRLKNSYWYAHERLNSHARVVYGDVFRLDQAVSDPSDIVIAGALLEHLNDQIGAIGSFARVAKETIIIAFTLWIDTDEMRAEPGLTMTDPQQDFGYWRYSRGLYDRILKNVGFEIAEVHEASAINRRKVTVTRPTIIARRLR